MKLIYSNNMSVVRGNNHAYVLMDLSYSSPWEVIVSMDRYITEAIDEFLDEMIKKIKTPAGNHLVNNDDTCAKSCEINSIIFHQLECKANLPEKARTTRHTAGNLIPHNEGEKSRQGQLKKTQKVTQLP